MWSDVAHDATDEGSETGRQGVRSFDPGLRFPAVMLACPVTEALKRKRAAAGPTMVIPAARAIHAVFDVAFDAADSQGREGNGQVDGQDGSERDMVGMRSIIQEALDSIEVG